MGMNYYCVHKNFGKRHIGKLSHKWAFVFHGYSEYDFGIRSSAAWKQVLSLPDIKILDEEGTEIDKNDFFNRVLQSLPEKKTTVTHDEESWHDEHGFAFLNKYFS